MNPRGNLTSRAQKIDIRDRLFTLSSIKASSGYKLEESAEVKVEAVSTNRK